MDTDTTEAVIARLKMEAATAHVEKPAAPANLGSKETRDMNIPFTAAALLGCLLARQSTAQATSGRANINRELKVAPSLENGFVCGVEIAEPRAFAIRSNGEQVFDKIIGINDATGVMLSSCAVSSVGTFVISGGAYDSTGKMATFLAFLDKSGNLGKVQKLGDFTASRLRFDRQGRLWAVGTPFGRGRKKGEAVSIVVKAFNADGTISSSLEIGDTSLGTGTGHFGKPHVAISDHELAILYKECMEVVSISLADGSVRRSPLSLSASDIVTGFAFSSRGELFVKYQSRVENEAKPRNQHILAKWIPATAQWQNVEGEEFRGPHAILGAQGDSFLMGFRSEYNWVPIPSQTEPTR